MRKAADGICRTLTRQYLGERAADRDFRDLTSLGDAIAEGHDELTNGVDAPPILMSYRA